MADARSVRKKVILRMLGHPVVLAPFVAGSTAAAGMLAFGGRVGLALFSFLAGALLSLGTFVTRLVVDDGRTARGVWTELERAEQQQGQAAVDELDRRLTAADNDPRPETVLRDLRALMVALDELGRQDAGAYTPTVIDIQAKARQIYEQSLRSLELTHTLGETAKRLLSPAARTPILEERERLIADLEAGTRQLGVALAALQRLASGGSSQSELARLRDDLAGSLDLASTVDARLQALLQDAGAAARQTVLPPTLEQKG